MRPGALPLDAERAKPVQPLSVALFSQPQLEQLSDCLTICLFLFVGTYKFDSLGKMGRPVAAKIPPLISGIRGSKAGRRSTNGSSVPLISIYFNESLHSVK